MPMLRMFQGHRETSNAAEKATQEMQSFEQELQKTLASAIEQVEKLQQELNKLPPEALNQNHEYEQFINATKDYMGKLLSYLQEMTGPDGISADRMEEFQKEQTHYMGIVNEYQQKLDKKFDEENKKQERTYDGILNILTTQSIASDFLNFSTAATDLAGNMKPAIVPNTLDIPQKTNNSAFKRICYSIATFCLGMGGAALLGAGIILACGGAAYMMTGDILGGGLAVGFGAVLATAGKTMLNMARGEHIDSPNKQLNNMQTALTRLTKATDNLTKQVGQDQRLQIPTKKH